MRGCLRLGSDGEEINVELLVMKMCLEEDACMYYDIVCMCSISVRQKKSIINGKNRKIQARFFMGRREHSTLKLAENRYLLTFCLTRVHFYVVLS